MEPSMFHIVWVNGDMLWFPKCQTNIATFVGYEVCIVKSNIGYGVLIFVPTYLLVYVAILFLGTARTVPRHPREVGAEGHRRNNAGAVAWESPDGGVNHGDLLR